MRRNRKLGHLTLETCVSNQDSKVALTSVGQRGELPVGITRMNKVCDFPQQLIAVVHQTQG